MLYARGSPLAKGADQAVRYFPAISPKGFDVTVAGRKIDVIAGKVGQFVVEVTIGGGKGKIGPALAQMASTGKQVVIYGENLRKGFVSEAKKRGIRVAQTLDELKKIVGGQ